MFINFQAVFYVSFFRCSFPQHFLFLFQVSFFLGSLSFML